MLKKTGDLLGPRFGGFGGFGGEPDAAPRTPQEPGASKTTNRAPDGASEPHGASSGVDGVAGTTDRGNDAGGRPGGIRVGVGYQRPTPGGVVDIAVREILGFPAGLMGKLPESWALHCAFEGTRFVVTNSRAAHRVARESRTPVLLGGEWYVLAHAAQNDRFLPLQFRAMLARKVDAAEWRLTHAGAFGGMPPENGDDLVWTCGEVFERVDATLVDVEVCA